MYGMIGLAVELLGSCIKSAHVKLSLKARPRLISQGQERPAAYLYVSFAYLGLKKRNYITMITRLAVL